MKKEQIVERATILANRIRRNRIRLMNKDAAALSLFNSLTSSVKQFLKETRFFLDNGDNARAAEFLVLAEKEYSRFLSKKGS